MLQVVGHPALGYHQGTYDQSRSERFFICRSIAYCLLNEWIRLKLIPYGLNIVVRKNYFYVGDAFFKWIPLRSQSTAYTGLLKVYDCLNIIIGFSAVFPIYEYQFIGHHFT